MTSGTMSYQLPMTRREYYVKCAKYKVFKIIKETFELDFDQYLIFHCTAHWIFIIYNHGCIQSSMQYRLCIVIVQAN